MPTQWSVNSEFSGRKRRAASVLQGLRRLNAVLLENKKSPPDSPNIPAQLFKGHCRKEKHK